METNLLKCPSAETANVIQHFMLNVCVLYAMTQHFAEWIQYSLNVRKMDISQINW